MFIDSFKDYVDAVHHVGNLLSTNPNSWEMVQASVFYIIKSASLFFWYLISFKWLTGFLEIPLFVKQTFVAIYQGESVIDVLNKENVNLYSFDTILLTSFKTGFSNSFFLALPITLPQLLGLRALLLHSAPAANSCLFGMVVGQFLFFACILLGLDFFLYPFADVSISGAIEIGAVSVLMADLNRMNIKFRMSYVEYKAICKQYFCTALVLAWVQHACIFETSSLYPTIVNSSFFSMLVYLFGLTIGTMVWSKVLWVIGKFIVSFFVTYFFVFTNVIFRRVTGSGLFSSFKQALAFFFWAIFLLCGMGHFMSYQMDYPAARAYRKERALEERAEVALLQKKQKKPVLTFSLKDPLEENCCPFGWKEGLNPRYRRRIKYNFD